MTASVRVAAAVAAVAAGRPVLVVDDADREDEGDLVLAADAATTENVAFVLRHTSGLLCVALTGERCDALGLPPMVAHNDDPHGTAFTVTVDARTGTTTGISATDRARTTALLADPAARPTDFRRPGHVLPLRARDGGVLARRGHTEAAVDLARLAGRAPAGLICEVVSADRTRMAGAAELRALAERHDLPLLSVADLVAHRQGEQHAVRRVVSTRLPTPHAVFTAVGYRGGDGREHVALVLGEPARGAVHVHAECRGGDPFRAARACGCRRRLDAAQAAVAAAGHGVIVYVRAAPAAGRPGVLPLRPADHGPTPHDLAVAAAVLRDLGAHRAAHPGDGVAAAPAPGPRAPQGRGPGVVAAAGGGH